MKYLVEELHADVNARDMNGYTPLHHAAARGDNEMILYLVSKGADVKAVARNENHRRHGELARLAHASVPRDHRPAGKTRRAQQPQLRVVLVG